MKARVQSSRRSLSSVSARVVTTVAGFALLVTGIGAAGEARAQGAASEKAVIEYRQYLMSAVGYNMGAIGTVLKNQLDRPGAVANHAQQMADAAKLMAAAFKQNVSRGKTDAKPEIWKDWAKFEKEIAEYEKAAAGLAAAARGSDPAAIGAATKALGDSCTDCHDSFRKPKEQSYKNR